MAGPCFGILTWHKGFMIKDDLIKDNDGVFVKGQIKTYEFGNKVGLAVTARECLVVGVKKSFFGRPYGATLIPQIEQVERVSIGVIKAKNISLRQSCLYIWSGEGLRLNR